MHRHNPSRRARWALCLAVAAMLAAAALPAAAQPADADEWNRGVFVEASWSGFSVRLSADGAIGFVSAKPRDDLLKGHIEQARAVKVISGLLEAGVLFALDEYPAARDWLEIGMGDRAARGRTVTMDGGTVRVRYRDWTDDKTVQIELPASGAAGPIMAWLEGFKALVTEVFFQG